MRPDGTKRVFLICAVVTAVFACAVLAINPIYADTLYDEDGLFENLTVAVCAIALIFSLALLFLRYKKKSGYIFWLFFSLLLVVFIGDEISWGMEYFGFTKHRIAGIGFDGLHDLLSIGVGAVKLTRDYIRSIWPLNIVSISIIVGMVSAIAASAHILIRGILRKRERMRGFFSKNLKWRPFFFLALGLLLIAAAMIIDDDNLVGFPHKAAVEESMEFLAAVSFLFGALSGYRENRCECMRS